MLLLLSSPTFYLLCQSFLLLLLFSASSDDLILSLICFTYKVYRISSNFNLILVVSSLFSLLIFSWSPSHYFLTLNVFFYSNWLNVFSLYRICFYASLISNLFKVENRFNFTESGNVIPKWLFSLSHLVLHNDHFILLQGWITICLSRI